MGHDSAQSGSSHLYHRPLGRGRSLTQRQTTHRIAPGQQVALYESDLAKDDDSYPGKKILFLENLKWNVERKAGSWTQGEMLNFVVHLQPLLSHVHLALVLHTISNINSLCLV